MPFHTLRTFSKHCGQTGVVHQENERGALLMTHFALRVILEQWNLLRGGFLFDASVILFYLHSRRCTRGSDRSAEAEVGWTKMVLICSQDTIQWPRNKGLKKKKIILCYSEIILWWDILCYLVLYSLVIISPQSLRFISNANINKGIGIYCLAEKDLGAYLTIDRAKRFKKCHFWVCCEDFS